MKENQADVDRLLKSWRVTTPLPPRFQEEVWKRIERAEAGTSITQGVRAWFAMLFARPAIAVSYVAVLLGIGLAAGFFQANHKTAQWDHQLASRYVQTLDPYQRGP